VLVLSRSSAGGGFQDKDLRRDGHGGRRSSTRRAAPGLLTCDDRVYLPSVFEAHVLVSGFSDLTAKGIRINSDFLLFYHTLLTISVFLSVFRFYTPSNGWCPRVIIEYAKELQ
jgi:hypothetical protein